jgi:TonB family protein
LSDTARDELLATLPVHEGDTVTTEELDQVTQRVKAFDEHLKIARSYQTPRGDGQPAETTLMITAPGGLAAQTSTTYIQELRSKALGATSPDNMPPPPPPPPPPGITVHPPERINVGGNVMAASLITKVEPLYPQLAKSARVEGSVILAAVIGKDGTVQELHSLGGPALLIQAAMDAVKQWVYRPTMLNGQPVQVATTLEINFSLNQ